MTDFKLQCKKTDEISRKTPLEYCKLVGEGCYLENTDTIGKFTSQL